MIQAQDTRRCPRCEKTLRLTESFYKDANRHNGYCRLCKTCDNVRRARDYARRTALVQKPPKDCKRCGTEIPRTNKYCAPCKQQVRKERSQNDVLVTCAHCGSPTIKRGRDLKRYTHQYCDKRCKGKAEHPPHFKLKVIKVRGTKPKPPRRWYAGYCHEHNTPQPFISKRPGQYCSPVCAKRAARRTGKKMRDKRIKAAGQRDRIDHVALAKRDGWRCHICKRKVSQKTWSIDHLIPLSAGGAHTWDNVALAHHSCNSKRSHTGAAQLRLAA